MCALEQEIIEKFRLLDKEGQQRVLLQLNKQPASEFQFDAWLKRVETLQAEVRSAQGGEVHVDVVGLLREIREDDD